MWLPPRVCRYRYQLFSLPCKHLQQPKQPDDMPTLPTKSSTNESSYQLATTKEACRCSYGLVGEQNSELICQCPQNEALSKADDGEHCVHCSKHHPQCLEPGATVSEAAVERGYFRRQGSEKIYQCLEAERCVNSSCAEGCLAQKMQLHNATRASWDKSH